MTAHVYYRLGGIIMFMVVSRALHVEQIGIFFFALSIAETLSVLGSFNLDPVLMRRTSQAPADSAEHLAAILGFRCLAAPLYILAIITFSVFSTRSVSSVVIVVGMFVLLENVYLSFSTFFVAKGRVLYSVGIGIVVQTMFLISFLITMRAFPSLWLLLMLNVGRSVALCIGGLVLSRRLVHAVRIRWDPTLLREGAPFALMALVMLFQERVGAICLGLMKGYEGVAYYSLAMRVLMVLVFIPHTVSTVLFPRIAASGLTDENRRSLKHIAVLLGIAGIVLSAALAFWGEALTSFLYGPMGHDVSRILRPLSLILPFQFLFVLLLRSLQALHHERRALWMLSGLTIICFVLFVVLIAQFGVMGAVGASVLTGVFQLVVVLFMLSLLSPHSVGNAISCGTDRDHSK